MFLYLCVGDGASLLIDLVTDLLSVGDKLGGVGVVTLLYGLMNTRKHRVLSEPKMVNTIIMSKVNFLQQHTLALLEKPPFQCRVSLFHHQELLVSP